MNEQEITCDIIAEIRALSNPISDGIIAINGRSIADRLDAAHKREVDALNEQIADLRQQRDLWSKRAAELVEKCNEQHAKMKRDMATTENSSAVGNAAKLREALVKILWCLEWMFNNTDDKSVQSHLGEPIALAKSALAAPARNCDVGTAREQLERFGKFCHANINMEGCGGNCPAFRTTRNDCELVWAQMPYEEGGAK